MGYLQLGFIRVRRNGAAGAFQVILMALQLGESVIATAGKANGRHMIHLRICSTVPLVGEMMSLSSRTLSNHHVLMK